ncbi:MAG: aminotransferase class V-fold PLP-dependent enzyme, partial [Ferruginibacter sp.]
MKLPVYLDNNATTKMDPAVLDAMMPYFLEHYGNAASRSHVLGLSAKDAVDLARSRVAQLIGAEPEEIIFTSGATESDNLAIKGVFETYKLKGNHVITVATEHKAVLDTCSHIEKFGGIVTILGVDKNGLIDLKELENSINDSTILISIMFGNNETGTVQNIKEIAKIAKERKVLFFTDATQAVGKIDVNVNDYNINLMAFSSHKIYGPKGVGALYVRRKDPRVKIIAQIDGGGHERNVRSGTLNVPGIVGFGKACEICLNSLKINNLRISFLRDKLESAILSIDETYLNSSTKSRLPNVT